MDVEEQKRLIVGEVDSHEDSHSTNKRGGLVSAAKRNWITIIAILYGIITTTLLAKIYSRISSNALPAPYSPINHLIKPELQDVWSKEHSIYGEEPSKELDDAWTELVRPMLIQVSASEVKDNSEEPDERLELEQGGYLASLGVFHELHCLRRLYWHMFEDHYFKNYTDEARAYERGHARHCIEALRRSLMCQANTSLYTFAWDEHNTHAKQVLVSNAQRQCVKWDPVHEWANSRTVGYNPSFYKPGSRKTMQCDRDNEENCK
ncbi:hypothetical protein M011DRAFT_480908 [Sporormia fimetaria CBS 119925]|uniref:Cyclochlorotine biosynthesis protein O n=1 Tax=Sporormia fimetaria CBS 119925 TaxID=1340428 RepID=A0A6A6V035_9PLEO|nr:hypothetical protein M011DRAFT_480908 [Sporormia fimetaria CBS 119925]